MEHDLNQKSVDIILPNYNSELYISETINSVLEQNFKNWNLIIVDDNSNNENKEILKKYDYHKNIKIIWLKKKQKGWILPKHSYTEF